MLEQKQNKAADHKQASWGLLGALAGAIAASLCCLGPLLLVALGASGAWIGGLGALERYRPFFIAASLGFLLLAFYRTYRSQQGGCSRDAGCTLPGRRRWNKLGLWSGSALVFGLFILPHFTPLLVADTTMAEPAATSTVRLQVDKMTCSGCTATVTKRLLQVDGVLRAKVTLDPPEALVTFDPERVTAEQLVEATASVGYPSQLLPETQ